MADPKELLEQAKDELSRAESAIESANNLIMQAEDALPPPPPPPPTTVRIGRLWVGIFGTDAFDYSKSRSYDAFIGHWFDSWAKQSAYKINNPSGTLLCYCNVGVAKNSGALDLATARAKGLLAKHNGAEIPNPWSVSDPNARVMDVGKPGVLDAYITAIDSKWGAQGWDGLMLDDSNAWYNLWRNGQSIDGYTSPEEYWTKAMRPLLANLADHYAPKVMIPNIGDWSAHTTTLTSGATSCSGGLEEHYLTWDTGAAAGNAEGCYAELRACVESGRRWWGVVHRVDQPSVEFAWAVAAVMAGNEAELVSVSTQTAYGSSAPVTSPVFDTDLVLPAEPLVHVPGSPNWSRRYADGTMIEVNTGSMTYQITRPS